MDSEIIKKANAAKSRLTLTEMVIGFGIVGTIVVFVVSIVWIAFVTAVILTQKVLGVQ